MFHKFFRVSQLCFYLCTGMLDDDDDDDLQLIKVNLKADER